MGGINCLSLELKAESRLCVVEVGQDKLRHSLYCHEPLRYKMISFVIISEEVQKSSMGEESRERRTKHRG
jgi:hypothetical protein